jgi:hypothetical protein
MDFSSINWFAVIACVLASMVIGSFWFNPKTFFPIWWKAIGYSDSRQPGMENMNMGVLWGGTVLASLIQAIFMNLMVNAMGSMTGGATLASGATAGFILWMGFVAPSSLTNKLFAGQLKAWMIEAGNHLVTFVVMGAILGAWR